MVVDESRHAAPDKLQAAHGRGGAAVFFGQERDGRIRALQPGVERKSGECPPEDRQEKMGVAVNETGKKGLAAEGGALGVRGEDGGAAADGSSSGLGAVGFREV